MSRSPRPGLDGRIDVRRESARDFFASMRFAYGKDTRSVKAYERSWKGWKTVLGFCWRGLGKTSPGDRVTILVGRAPSRR